MKKIKPYVETVVFITATVGVGAFAKELGASKEIVDCICFLGGTLAGFRLADKVF